MNVNVLSQGRQIANYQHNKNETGHVYGSPSSAIMHGSMKLKLSEGLEVPAEQAPAEPSGEQAPPAES